MTRSYDEIRSFAADVNSLANVGHQEIVWRHWLNTTAIPAGYPFVQLPIVLRKAGQVVFRVPAATP